jgi:hypothetical protein
MKKNTPPQIVIIVIIKKNCEQNHYLCRNKCLTALAVFQIQN